MPCRHKDKKTCSEEASPLKAKSESHACDPEATGFPGWKCTCPTHRHGKMNQGLGCCEALAQQAPRLRATAASRESIHTRTCSFPSGKLVKHMRLLQP